jgi:hypothetical protein
MTTELLPTPLLSRLPQCLLTLHRRRPPRAPGGPCIGSGDQNECAACRGEPSHRPRLHRIVRLHLHPRRTETDPCRAERSAVQACGVPGPYFQFPSPCMLPVVPTAKPESHGGSCPNRLSAVRRRSRSSCRRRLIPCRSMGA